MIRRDDELQLTFEYIDNKEQLALPVFFKSLIEITKIDNIHLFTDYIYNNYSNKCKRLKKLLSFIRNMTDIPIELISKYYARIYSFESDDHCTNFYSDLNKDLRNNKAEKYLPYIKVLYEGVKLKALSLASNKILYRGTLIFNNEIDLIKKYLNTKKDYLPGAIVFSKTFLSFTKKKEVANDFLDKHKNIKSNLSKALFILEKDNNINYSLSTHADIDKLSPYDEEEVLFFPFSTFEIKEINKSINKEKEEIYIINLLYLGKYVLELEETLKNDENIIPDTEFKKQIMMMGLIDEDKVTYIKELIQNFEVFKTKINEMSIYKPPSDNCIISELNIGQGKVGKDIRIINSYEQSIGYNNNKNKKNNNNNNNNNDNNNIDDNIKYCNELEIKDNCEIMINGNKIDFNYFHKFEKKGKYKIEYIFKKKLKNINHMFYKCSDLISIDLSNLNSQNVTEIRNIFSYCDNLQTVNLSNFNSQNIYDMREMFYGCKSLTSVNLSNFNTQNVYYISKMFSECNSLTNIDLSNFYTENISDMSYLFSGCNSLKEINLSSFKTQNVTDMSNLFTGCSSLEQINLSNFNTERVTNMKSMFDGCNSLKDLDLSSFNTKNVTNMKYIFNGCENLEKLNLSSFNTENVTDMSYMFSGCNSLENLDISNFKTDNVTNMKCMFDGCTYLLNVNISNFNTQNVTNMSYMFHECAFLKELDLSNFETQNVTDMSFIFKGCNNLEKLNISKFDISNIDDNRYLFSECKSLLRENLISKKEILDYFDNKHNN